MSVRPVGTVKTLKIDDRDVGARMGETILDVALENGLPIPTLCHFDGLSEMGGCRLCVVEIAGRPRPAAACVTQVEEGMEVRTDSERLRRYRRLLLELFFTERNHVCAVCVANGHCELQTLASEQGMDHVRVPYLHPTLPVDASHARFAVDHNRCILCTRCVRVCDEIEGAHTWDLAGRGITSRVITDLDQPWGSSDTCTSCGKCIHVCPTGALFEKGRSAADMVKQRDLITFIATARKERRWIR
jgi:bidirectional [NiFe] hydrogenase diaphorase subunit